MAKDIQLTVLGGGQEIGANCYLLKWGDYNILLDAGMHPTKIGSNALVPLEKVPLKIDALILTHGHFDHIGSLPFIYQNRFIEKIFVPEIAVEVIIRMLQNTSKLITEEGSVTARYLFSKAYSKYKNSQLFTCLLRAKKPLGIPFQLLPGLEATFFRAGHILGASGVLITDGNYSFVYTGDINLSNYGVHVGAELPEIPSLDFLLIESTRAGEKGGMTESELWEEFFRLINMAVNNNARILFPTFALGRTQDILGLINYGKEKQLIPKDLSVYLSGLGSDLTKIYKRNFKELREAFRDKKYFSNYEVLIGNDIIVKYNELRKAEKPAIFIASSGMLIENTPSYILAKEMVSDPEEFIIFTGYLSPESIGYKLLNTPVGKEPQLHPSNNQKWGIVLTPHRYYLRFSSHATASKLKKVCSRLKPKNCAIVHGDVDSIKNMVANLSRTNINVLTPTNFETLLLYQNGDREAVSLKSKPAVIITIGTSLLTNFKNLCPGQKIERDGLINFIIQQKDKPNAASAELQTIREMYIPEGAYYYLITSDEEDCMICSFTLAQYFTNQNLKVQVRIIDGLRKEFKTFETKGLPNLVNEIIDIIEAHNNQVMIVATGGFKAETAYATIIGLLSKVPVYYIHEDFNSIIQFPILPVNLDLKLYLECLPLIQKILNSPSITEARQIMVAKLPPELHILFTENTDYGQLRLTPLGLVIHRLVQRQLFQGRTNMGLDLTMDY